VLVDRLAEKDVWAVLQEARQIRNQRAHGGVVSTAQLTGWLVMLERLLGDLEQALGAPFEDIDVVLPEEGRFRHGLYTYSRARRLRGAHPLFEEVQVRTREPLDSDYLAIVGRAVDISAVVHLVPLVRVKTSMSKSRNACYFFDSRRDGSVSYMSYHFEDEPRMQLPDADLEELAQQISNVGGTVQ
jgi:hypothetical protein